MEIKEVDWPSVLGTVAQIGLAIILSALLIKSVR